HGVRGPSGPGTSTLACVLAGKADYGLPGRTVTLDGEDLRELEADEPAARGVCLAFQYPLEIPGVGTMTFLKAAVNAQRRAREEGEISTPDFMKLVKTASGDLGISQDMLKSALNVGYSGGVMKRIEILQLSLLQP